MLVDTLLSVHPFQGAGPSADHYFLYHGTSLSLENITFEDYVVGCLLSFVAGAQRVVCQLKSVEVYLGHSVSSYECREFGCYRYFYF